MNNIGILEYVVGIIHDEDTWYYVGDHDAKGNKLETSQQYSSAFADAKRYGFYDLDDLREELETLPKTLTYKILEIQRCPKCKKEFIEHPALSRVDNKTAICPECGVREAMEAYTKLRGSEDFVII